MYVASLLSKSSIDAIRDISKYHRNKRHSVRLEQCKYCMCPLQAVLCVLYLLCLLEPCGKILYLTGAAYWGNCPRTAPALGCAAS